MIEKQLLFVVFIIFMFGVGFWAVREIIKLKTQDKLLFTYYISSLLIIIFDIVSWSVSYFAKNPLAVSILKIYIPLITIVPVSILMAKLEIRRSGKYKQESANIIYNYFYFRQLNGVVIFLIIFIFIMALYLVTSL